MQDFLIVLAGFSPSGFAQSDRGDKIGAVAVFSKFSLPQTFWYSSAVAVEYDEIGVWSEVKLAIIEKYASAYARIMESQ